MTSECLNEVQTSFHKSNWTRSEFPLPLVSSCGEGVETLFILTRSNRCSTKGIAIQVVTWFPESPFLNQVWMECSSISLFVTMKEMDIQRTRRPHQSSRFVLCLITRRRSVEQQSEHSSSFIRNAAAAVVYVLLTILAFKNYLEDMFSFFDEDDAAFETRFWHQYPWRFQIYKSLLK